MTEAGADLNARKEEWKRQRKKQKKKKKKMRKESALIKHVESEKTTDVNCNTAHALELSGRRPSNLLEMSVAEKRELRHEVLEKRRTRQLGPLTKQGTENHL